MAAKRKHIAWGRILLLVIAVLAVVVLLGFRLKSVDIEGNSQVSDQEVEKVLHYDRYGFNTLLFWFMNRNADTDSNEMISSIDVNITGMQSVSVIVTENTPVGCIESSGQYAYFDEDGVVIAEKDEVTGEAPEVSGLDISGVKTGETIQVAENRQSALKAVLDAATELSIRGIQADKITVDENARITVDMDDVQVSLGSDVYMSEKISELSDLQEQLSGLSGVLHLENYDPDKDTIVFTKDQ